MKEFVTLSDGSVLDVGRWPLPDGLTDDVPLNRAQLADAFRVSENTVTAWIRAGMPVQTDGKNGVAYEFRLSHCYAWRMQRDAESRDAKARGDQLAMQAAMVFLNLDGEEAQSRGAMTADEVRKWSEAEYARNRVDEQRRDLLRAGPMREMCEKLLGAVRLTLATLPDYCEREFGLGPADVSKLEGRADQLMVTLAQIIEADLLKPGEVIDIDKARVQTELRV